MARSAGRKAVLLLAFGLIAYADSASAATGASARTRGVERQLLAAKGINPPQTVGFGDNAPTPFGYSDNQRVASSSSAAAVGQPVAVARVATQAAVPCEVLVQQQAGDGYQCAGGYCLQLTLYVRNWQTALIPTPWTLTVAAPTFTGVSGAYNIDTTFSGTTITGTASDSWEALQANGANNINVGWTQIANAASASAFFPTAITLNSVACAVDTVWSDAPATPPVQPSSPSPTPASGGSLLPPPPSPPVAPAPPSPPPAPPYVVPGSPLVASQPVSVSGTQIIGVDGKPLQIKGLNYFGFDNGNTAPDGIWQGDVSITRDLVTIMRRQRLLGFNALRLPFSMSSLFTQTPRSFSGACTTTSDSSLLAATTEPGITTPSVGVELGYEPTQPAGTCDSYLPNDSVFNRFLWFINFLAKNGFYVLIDNHLNDDRTLIDQGQAVWLQYWARIMTAIAADPVSVKFVMYDILNEPDSQGVPWERAASGTNPPGMADNYLDMMDQGYKINPNAVYFIEGCGQSAINANWGDGFSTDPTLFPSGSSGSPIRFFTTLLTKPYVNSVVISPHVYPPTITGAGSDYSGAGLLNRLSTAHGYLNKKGFCNTSGTCKTFPIAVGETGTKLTDARDLQMMPQYANYLNNVGDGADGLHNPITSWFWWCWNANSGDTGGIVDNDWLTILWRKPDYLETIGLQPFYAQYRSGSPAATPAPTNAPAINSPTAAPSAVPTVAPTATSSQAPTAIPTAGPTATPTAAQVTTPGPTAATGSVAGSCSKGNYATASGCKACVSSAKPFTKTYGGSTCVQPTTLSSASTVCSNLILPASIRGASAKSLAKCIDTKSGSITGGKTVTLYLPLTSKVAPFLKGTSTYVKGSLRLAFTIPPLKSSSGVVKYSTITVGSSGTKRMQVQFTDTYGALKAYKGRNAQINGVLSRGGTLLSQCFSSILPVCA